MCASSKLCPFASGGLAICRRLSGGHRTPAYRGICRWFATYPIRCQMQAKTELSQIYGDVRFTPEADKRGYRPTFAQRPPRGDLSEICASTFCHEFSKRASIDNEKSINGARNRPGPRPA